MFNYAEMTTAKLVALLFEEEDRVSRRHIEELVSRGEESAAPLRDILVDEDYWYEGEDGNYWIVVHAIVILSAMRDKKALQHLIEIIPHAYFSNHDDATQILPAALAQYGDDAIDPYMDFIGEHRGAHHDNQDYSYCRYLFSAALTRIALEHDAIREKVTEFICANFADPQEDDSVFLSFSAAHPIALDEERGIEVLRMAYKRGAVEEEITGKLDEFIEALDYSEFDAFRDLQHNLYDFYDPDEIDERRRSRVEVEADDPYAAPGMPPDMPPDMKAVPAGYSVTRAGNVISSGKIGRNDPCPCGSGKKYKKCCGAV